MRTTWGVDIEATLLPLLERYGLAIMAKSALASAKSKLGYDDDSVLSSLEVEHLIEEIMVGFRTFCTPEDRKQLWIELVDFLA